MAVEEHACVCVCVCVCVCLCPSHLLCVRDTQSTIILVPDADCQREATETLSSCVVVRVSLSAWCLSGRRPGQEATRRGRGLRRGAKISGMSPRFQRTANLRNSSPEDAGTARTFREFPKGLDRFTELREQYGPVFSVSLGPRRVVVLCGHEAVKEALVDHAEAFGSRGQMPTLDRIFQGYGLLLANGVRWKQLRHFSIAALRDLGMGKRLLEERVAAEAQALVEEIGETKGSPFEPGRPVSLAVGNVVASLAFGQRFDPQDQAFLALLDAIRGLFRELSSPWTQLYEMFSGLLRFLPGPHNRILVHVGVLHDFVTGRMRRNQETLDPSCPRDYIDAFLIKMEEEKQNPHSEFHARNLTLSTVHLFFGGTEMVSATLRYGFLLLAKHPEVQGKVHEEIERVVGRDRSPAAEDRSRMPYTQAVIHEVQRFCYVLPLGIPHAVSRDTQFRGYTLPKGTDVLCALGSALRDPGHFRDPERFNPGNFLGEDGRFQKNPAFMAFSAGKRICLGEGLARLELFLFLTTVLQRFALTWPGDPQEIDLTPQGSGFWNLPPEYQICAVPR
ncbi:cytochrome P450 2G1-like isoform X2 [Pelodiscus sinensis]|uniref:cytochrome P450 2G1-like isoform X2 n=1 Tax=Pelodiscus sinensis TaxID=13735 RepID=UPI003F6CA97A